MRARRRLVAGTAVLVTLLTLAACGDDENPGHDDGTAWPRSAHPVDTTQLAWADGTTVHLGSTTIDTEKPFDQYVVAGDGVWFVPADDDRDVLWRASSDGAEATEGHADPRSLTASPDGRYLAFLDMTTGRKDDYGTPLAQAVVVDLHTGREVYRSSAGMGDPGSDDLTDLYEDAELGVLGISDETAWFVTPGDVYAVDLSSGDTDKLPDDVAYDDHQPWYAPVDADGGLWNPARTWSFADTPTRDRLVPVSGPAVTPRTGTPTWSLARWLDDQTAIGFAFDRPPDDGQLDPDANRRLITCTVPSGACTFVSGDLPFIGVVLPESSLILPS